jgi:hypothetical protein
MVYVVSESTLLPKNYEDYIPEEPAPNNKFNSSDRPGIAPWGPMFWGVEPVPESVPMR